jgi:hypothetical protein
MVKGSRAKIRHGQISQGNFVCVGGAGHETSHGHAQLSCQNQILSYHTGLSYEFGQHMHQPNLQQVSEV